jgi:hypothetical protein
MAERKLDDTPSGDYDDMTPSEVLDLFEKVKHAWAPRDQIIDAAVTLRTQNWKVAVPKAWRQTATQHHSSRSREIPQRVVGTLMLNLPVYTRANPGNDFAMGEDANQVERFMDAEFRYFDRKAVKSKSAWEFILDCFVGKGGVCVGSMLTPQTWAGAPLFMDGDRIRQEHWRDSKGKTAEDYGDVDMEASARAFSKAVDEHRQQASSHGAFPLKRRILPPEQTYPLIVDDQLLALFIERKTTLLELKGAGWDVAIESGQSNPTSMIEVHTPNRIRYFLKDRPIVHKDSGEDGITTNFGRVPWVYQTSLNAGETEYGSWGLPVLGLVDSNLRTIDTLRTYLMNAVHLASFTSFYIEYIGDDKSVGSLVDTKSGTKLTTFEFKSGTIMDFGPNRKVVPLTHPGLNADFWKALAAEEADIDRIVPRTLGGEPTSSGYNTVVSSVQARALYNSIYRAGELLLEQVGEFDMRHIETLPGPVYLQWEKPTSSLRPKFERVKLSSGMIGGYYELNVSIDRTIDYVTEGTWAANQVSAGIGDLEWAAEKSGIHDYEDMLARQARDRVFKSPVLMAALDERAVKRFKLQSAVQEAAAAGRIQPGADGTPMVTMKDGRQAGPGIGVQTPEMQGGAGAALGGSVGNMAPQSTGGPNLAATNNPAANTPGSTGRDRFRRRGGALPGAGQRQPNRPMQQNPAQ